MPTLEYSIPDNPKPQFATREGNMIDIDVQFPDQPEPVRFTAAASDPGWEHSEEIYQRALAGEFGPVLAFRRDRGSEWRALRMERDSRLTSSDWTQQPDAPVDRAAWARYRQALRDLPATIEDPADVVWPSIEDFMLVPGDTAA